MIAAYSDIVGTAWFILASASLWFTWWSRHHEPERQVAVQKALKRSADADRVTPQFRSDVINALQFIEEDPAARPLNILIPKEAIRLKAVQNTWTAAAKHIPDEKLRQAVTALELALEIAWLESPQPGPEEDVRARLAQLGVRLRRVLARLDEAGG